MTLLNIYSLDDIEESNVVASLPEGKHIIGRGGILKVTDKRISRQHAVVQVDADKVTLTSLHINPCFFKAFNGKTLTIIAKGEECELNDGDQFALLPEDCWFRIKVEHEHINGTSPNRAVNSKRCHDLGCEENDCSKKPRLLTNEDTSEVAEPQTSQDDQFKLELNPSQHIVDDYQKEKPNVDILDQCIQEEYEVNKTTENNHTPETSHIVELQTSPSIISETTQEIKDEPVTNDEENNIAQSSTDIKQEPKDEAAPVNGNANVASGSGIKKTRRERCWYKERCFRKNPNHRDLFSHPGDDDYPSDPEDDRPECPYGVSCYRKNVDHRREYKHSTRPAQKPSNFSIYLGQRCPFCPHCNHNNSGGGGGRKPDYESDLED